MHSLARLASFTGLTLLFGVLGACANGGFGDSEDDPGDASRPDRLDPTGDSGGPVTPGPVDSGTDASGPGSDAGDACATALAALSYAFDANEGWTHGISDGVSPPPTWPYDPWLRGTSGIGTACPAGACFGTELTKNYAQCQRGYLLSPKLDLSACSGRDVAVTFKHAYAFWSGTYNSVMYYDGGVVEASGNDGAAYATLTGATSGTVKINPSRAGGYSCTQSTNFGVNNKAGFTGEKKTIETVTLALPASALTASARVRFSFASGVSSSTTNPDTSRNATDFGWRIDDVGFVVR